MADRRAPAARLSTGFSGPGRSRAMTGVWNTVALVFAAVMAFPLYWLLLTAVQPGRDLLSAYPKFWPTGIQFGSFRTVFADSNFATDLLNTAIITVGAIVLGLAVGFMAAVGVARFRFAGRNPFVVAMLIVQMVPLVALVIPLFIVLDRVGLYDQLFGVVLAYLVFTIPYVVWTLRTFIVNIPRELDEAAMVDGCTQWGAFFRVVLPLTVPGLITTGVYCWIQAWNEFAIANTLLTSAGKQTSMVWLTGWSASQTHGADYGAQMAGSLLISLPVIILFTLLQKRLAGGLTAGAVKG
ncbi:carbohydrate ABC transporter permease [Phaeacidiphilus oryzae]|jgi:multiple sugar transport system permease protein/N,N'-diacetylchitobiose transport system permease protein|uniref:carbohydrate ABC transporter permease n=1 Tax=Phaeacidiphilus oryzae TaxID=348818 RepID=UPI000566ED9A|nr:carbohydrate ABC transporter permease [Phaeacidiphilus oryzae]